MSLMTLWAGLALGFLLGWICRAMLPRDPYEWDPAQRVELLRALRELDTWLDERLRRDQDSRR